LDILRLSGLVADYSVRVLDNTTPLSGATVILNAGSVLDTAVTGATGEVTFIDVPASIITVDLIATSYISMRYTSNLATGGGAGEGERETIWVNGQQITVADPRVELIIAQMLSSTATASMATVKGTVVGNTDLTTEDPEALAGLVVEAQIESDVTTFVLIANADGTIVDNIRFGPSEPFGRDTTAADGTYSFTVPAYTDLMGNEIEYSVNFPAQYSADQTVGIINSDDSVQVTTTAATFGPYAVDTEDFPFIHGYQSDFNTPPAAGSGFGISTATAYGRSLSEDTDWSEVFDANEGDRADVSGGGDFNAIATLTENGSGWTTTPVTTITDGGSGAGATATFSLNWDFEEIEFDTIKSFFANGEVVDITIGLIGVDRSDHSTVDTMLIAYDGYGGGSYEGITTNFLAETVTLGTSDGANTSLEFSAEDNNFTESDANYSVTMESGDTPPDGAGDGFELLVTSVFVKLTGATAGDTIISADAGFSIDYSTSYRDFEIDAGGTTGYTDPSFSISAAGGTAPAFTVDSWSTTWAFNLVQGSGYKTVPQTMDFKSTKNSGLYTTTGQSENTASSRYSAGGEISSAKFSDQLMAQGDTLAPRNTQTASWRSIALSIDAPTLEITDNASEAANLYVVYDEDYVTDDGSISDLNGGVGGTADADDRGKGYTSEIALTINPRTMVSGSTLSLTPTTAAVISLTGQTTDAASGIVTWDGTYSIDEEGAGYVGNINAAADTEYTDFEIEVDGAAAGATSPNSGTFSVAAGAVIIVDADYGTGERAATLKGDDEEDGN
jgi:hypothetical protein